MFDRLTVGVRLSILLIIASMSLIGTGTWAIFMLNSIWRDVDEIFKEGSEEANSILRFNNQLQIDIVRPINLVAAGINSQENNSEKIDANFYQFQNSLNNYFTHKSHLQTELQANQIALNEQLKMLQNRIEETYIKAKNAIKTKNNDQLLNIVEGELIHLASEFNATSNALSDVFTADTKLDYKRATESIKSTEVLFWMLFVAIILIQALLAYLIIRSIVKPLNYAVENIDRLSTGDLSESIEVVSGGELGHLLEALQSQVERMREMVGWLKEEVNTMNSSAEELSHSIVQFSSGTSETASSITETTSTLEELKQTSHNSVEKAKEVLTAAQTTLNAVNISGDSVTETINDMQLIKDRMQIISDSILKLSEKTNAISVIMDSVNDIAEQSNLLSVNAAIEAAKAGEMGKSFSVVASEIRHLAEQSKEATIQVKSLLSDIQHATNAAVLSTEQGNKAVIKGVDQSKSANEAMVTLVDQMGSVTSAANQIVLANEQQLLATGQISIAMSNINEASNQHSEQLGQIEAVVDTMKKLSVDLQNFCSRYRLPVEIKNTPTPQPRYTPKEKNKKAMV